MKIKVVMPGAKDYSRMADKTGVGFYRESDIVEIDLAEFCQNMSTVTGIVGTKINASTISDMLEGFINWKLESHHA